MAAVGGAAKALSWIWQNGKRENRKKKKKEQEQEEKSVKEVKSRRLSS